LLGVFERDSELLRNYVMNLHRCCNRVLTAQVFSFDYFWCKQPNTEKDKLETKSIVPSGTVHTAGYSVIPPGVELITISIVITQSIWHNSAADFLWFGKFPPQICESCGTTYQRNYEMFSALWRTFSSLTNVGNGFPISL